MNLAITQIFPNFNLAESAATKAAITDAIDCNDSTQNEGDSVDITVAGTTTRLTWVATLESAAANEIQVLRSGTAGTDRDRARKAINGTEDTNVAYGSGLDSAEGVQGLKATNGTAPKLNIEAEDAGAITITVANVVGTFGAAGSDTGTDASGTIEIPLSDLGIPNNDLTITEGSTDFRKLGYHFIRKFYDYLDKQETVDSVSITSGGAGYAVGDVLVFTGGGNPTRAAAGTVSAVDGTGAITAVTISDAGEGYTSTPTVAITSATVTGAATLTAVLTDLHPDNFSVTRSGVTESDGTLRRIYSTEIGFSEEGLELASE